MSAISDIERAEKRVGTTIARRWRLDALVANTAVAATYRARHRNGLETAIKIIHPSRSGHPSLVERFLQEAHLANRIEHAGVERVLDDGLTEDGCAFLVMELLEGDTLEERRVRAGGKLTLDEAIVAFDGLLDALVAIHAAGVHHRNLKPANVFLATDGRVVLTDFGRARLAESDLDSSLMPLAIDGVAHGPSVDVPPEQARGRRREIDALSDIWSSGAILFTTLSGRRVHDGETNDERLARAQTKHAPQVASVLPTVAPELAKVIDRALSFEKDNRWPSASEMRHAYWLATGRSVSTVPSERVPGRRMPFVIPQTPADGWEARGWPRDVAASPSKAPVLLPPIVADFVKNEAPPESLDSVAQKRRRSLLLTSAIVIASLFAIVTMGIVAFALTD